MKLALNIPDRDWWQLTAVAERRGTTASEMVQHAVLGILGEETARQAAARARRDVVVEMAAAGFTDTLICERTGEHRQYVAHTRNAAGIKANRQRRSETEGASA